MDSIGIVRVLWRRRLALGLGALLALGAGTLATYRVSLDPPALQSRAATSGYAVQRVLVDTPDSLVADSRPRGAPTITTRATLFGALLAGGDARRAIAARLGLRADQLGVLAPGDAAPQVPTPLAVQALEVARPRQPYLVTVAADPGLPVLTIRADAPDAVRAENLATATTAVLGRVAGRAQIAGGEARIERLGTATTGSVARSSLSKRAAGALAILLLWGAAIVAFDGLARRRTGGVAALGEAV